MITWRRILLASAATLSVGGLALTAMPATAQEEAPAAEEAAEEATQPGPGRHGQRGGCRHGDKMGPMGGHGQMMGQGGGRHGGAMAPCPMMMMPQHPCMGMMHYGMMHPGMGMHGGMHGGMQGMHGGMQGMHGGMHGGKPHGGDRHKDRFAKMDSNGDGKVSQEEFVAFRVTKFQKMDADGDGFVTVEEIEARRGSRQGGGHGMGSGACGGGHGMHQGGQGGHGMHQGPGGARHAARIQAMDNDGDGVVSDEEVAAFRLDAFETFDADGNGVVVLEEFRMVAFGPGPHDGARHDERKAERFKQIDADGNGEVTKEEYLGATRGGRN